MQCIKAVSCESPQTVLQNLDEDIKNFVQLIVVLKSTLPKNHRKFFMNSKFELVLRPCGYEPSAGDVILKLLSFLEVLLIKNKALLLSKEKWKEALAITEEFLAHKVCLEDDETLQEAIKEIFYRIINTCPDADLIRPIVQEDSHDQAQKVNEITLNNLASERYTLRCMQIAEVARIIYLKISLRILGYEESSSNVDQEIDLKKLNWKQLCPKNFEEIAITMALFQLYAKKDDREFSHFLKDLTKSQKSFSKEMKKVICTWQQYRLATIACQIYHFFQLRYQRLEGIYKLCKDYKISPNSTNLNTCFQRIHENEVPSKSKSLKDAFSLLDRFHKDTFEYFKNSKITDILYKKNFWDRFDSSDGAIEFVHVLPYSVLEGTILTPKEFTQLKISPLSCDRIDEFFKTQVLFCLEDLSQDKESSLFRKIVSFVDCGALEMKLIQKELDQYLIAFPDSILDSSKEQKSRNCDLDDLSSELKKLHIRVPSIQSPNGTKRKKKSRHRGHRRITNEMENDVDHLIEKPPCSRHVVVLSSPLVKNSDSDQQFIVHQRVLDWFSQAPRVLTFPQNKDLSSVDKKLLKIFHAYPLVIAQKAISYGFETSWYSQKTKKHNRHFSLVGQVKILDEKIPVIQGVFTECLDSKTGELYHHCFTKKTFNYLVDAYQKEEIRKLQTAIEEELSIDDQALELSSQIVQISNDKVVIEEREYVTKFIVNDAVEYTICAPPRF